MESTQAHKLMAYAAWAVIIAISLLVSHLQSKTKKSECSPIFPEKQSLPTLPPIEPLHDFVLDKTAPGKWRPWKPVYNITMAIERDTPSNLIALDRNYVNNINGRKAIIAQYPTKTHGYIQSGADAIHEVYTYLTEIYLPTRYPAIFVLENGQFVNKATNSSYPLFNHCNLNHEKGTMLFDPLAILRALGEIVEEDIFLLKQDPNYGSHRLVAFVCCCPSGFDPSEKLGLILKDIHTPVPSYEKIGASMERFFSRLEVGKNVKRTNWSVTTHSNLFDVSLNHVKEGMKVELDQEIDCSNAYCRIERQTLSRLPQTHTVMFSFKTYLYPLAKVKAEGLGLKLAESIEGLKDGNAPGMWKYKGAVRWGKSVLAYLRS